MLIEEIPPKRNNNSSTIYFSSSINLSARPNPRLNLGNNNENNQPKAKKAKINYNLNDLMNKQIQTNDGQKANGPLKSTHQIALEKAATRRILDLSKEANNTNFELPKNFEYRNRAGTGNKLSRQGSTPGTKKILSARRNLNSYFEEERNLVSINTILTISYHYLDQFDAYTNLNGSKELTQTKLFRPRIKLCCICSNISSYARCMNCGLFYCNIKCYKIHQESRCT